MTKKLRKRILAAFVPLLAASVAAGVALTCKTQVNAEGYKIDGLFSGTSVTVTQNERLPDYMEKINYNGKIYDNSEITAVKIQADENSKSATIRYNRIIDLTDVTEDTHFADFIVANKNKMEYDTSATLVTQDLYDFRYFNIRLTDVYDSSNYVEINFERRQDFRHLSSVRVSTNTHKSAGWYSAASALRESPYGTPLLSSFTGCPANASGVYNVISASYNDEEKAVYAYPFWDNNGRTVVRDLDSPDHLLEGDNLWGGFTTGEVYLSFGFANIQDQQKATIYLFTVNGQDVTGESITDETAPAIRLDDRSFEPNAPLAEQGRAYKVFSANAYDSFDGKIDSGEITCKAFKNYDTVKEEVAINNGEFVPDEAGVYTLEYTVSDKAGNMGKKLVPVTVKTKLIGLVLDVNADYGDTVSVGETIAISDAVTVNGGAGRYATETYIENVKTGEKIYPENLKAVFTNPGYYNIVYFVSDYIGNEKYVKYTVKAEIGKNPLVILPSMPDVFVAGKSLVLPHFTAVDYYSFSAASIEAKKEYLISTDGWATHKTYKEGEKITFENAGNVCWKIRAAGVVNGGLVTESESRAMAVIKPESIGEYFYDFSGAAVLDYSDTENPTYITDRDTELAFANAIAGYNFNFNFTVPEGRDGFNALELKFCDTEVDKKAVVRISKKDEKSCNVYLNGSKVYELNARLAGGERFEVYVTDNALYINAAYICRLTGEENEEILSSGKTYFSFAFKNVRGNAAIKVTRLNNHYYMGLYGEGENFDMTAPIIMLRKGIKTVYNLGDEVVIPAAVGADVLDSEAAVTVEVRSGGNVVYTKTGNLEDYSFIANKPADYTVVYSVVDSHNNRARLNYNVHVYNRSKPSLTVDGKVAASAKVGGEIKLPAASAKDYFGNELKVNVLVIEPNGRLQTVESSFTAEKAGTYRVRYVAIDGDYNFTVREYEVKVV